MINIIEEFMNYFGRKETIEGKLEHVKITRLPDGNQMSRLWIRVGAPQHIVRFYGGITDEQANQIKGHPVKLVQYRKIGSFYQILTGKDYECSVNGIPLSERNSIFIEAENLIDPYEDMAGVLIGLLHSRGVLL